MAYTRKTIEKPVFVRPNLGTEFKNEYSLGSILGNQFKTRTQIEMENEVLVQP